MVLCLSIKTKCCTCRNSCDDVFVPVNAMKACEEVEVELLSFITSALNGD
jgi:hypothetical protein